MAAEIRDTQHVRIVPIEGEPDIRITQHVRLIVQFIEPANFRITQNVRLTVIEDPIFPSGAIPFPALTVAI